MLEKPDLPDEKIITCLQSDYGLSVTQVQFLPLGADQNTAVYRVTGTDGTLYFFKIRAGAFDTTAVELPKFLHDQGIPQIIAPLPTKTGQLWANLDAYTTILYPFIDGRDGYHINLSDHHWVIFGQALKHIHATELPKNLKARIQVEAYSACYRETVRLFLEQVVSTVYRDPVAIKTAALMRAERGIILSLLERAEQYAQTLKSQTPSLVLCHADLHAGNILIDAHDNFYIVDWDAPILAPKERDLMFVAGCQGFRGHTAQEEEILFYQGYGQTHVDALTLAYYRYERIIQDIAAFGEQLLLTGEGGADREQSFIYLRSNFLPGNTIDVAQRAADQAGL